MDNLKRWLSRNCKFAQFGVNVDGFGGIEGSGAFGPGPGGPCPCGGEYGYDDSCGAWVCGDCMDHYGWGVNSLCGRHVNWQGTSQRMNPASGNEADMFGADQVRGGNKPAEDPEFK